MPVCRGQGTAGKMFTFLKHVISIIIWVIVAAVFLIAKSPELFAFWALFGFILIVAFVIKFIWKWIVGIFFPTVSARSYFFFILTIMIIGLAAYQYMLVPQYSREGANDREISRHYPVDKFLPKAETVTIRAFTVKAPVHKVYPWIKQLATEGVLNFNFSVLDIIRNRPAEFILKDIPSINIGDRFLIGKVVQNEPNKGLTIELNRSRFPWNKFKGIYTGYYVFPKKGGETRVVIKTKADYHNFWAWFSAKYLIEFCDYWVSQYHLNTIKIILEKSKV